MARAKGGARVRGPYAEKDRQGNPRWRVKVYASDGGCSSPTFPTWDEADAFRRGAEEGVTSGAARSVGAAIREWDAAQRARADAPRPRSLDVVLARVIAFFEPSLDAPLASLCRGDKCAALYNALRARKTRRNGVAADAIVSVAWQRCVLKDAKAVTAWWVASGYLPADPLAGVAPQGKRRRRKQIASADDRAAFGRVALADARAGTLGAIAALTALYFRLRQGEVTGLRVGDLRPIIARDGTQQYRLRITGHGSPLKTAGAEGDYRVPEQMRDLLANLAAGRPADAWLFESVRAGKRGPHSHAWLNKNVKRLCRLAGIEAVCAHSLRSLGASMGAEEGQALEAIARGLRHDSPRTTRDYYIAPAAAQQQRHEQHLEVVLADFAPAPALVDPLATIRAALASLPAEQRAVLLADLALAPGGRQTGS